MSEETFILCFCLSNLKFRVSVQSWFLPWSCGKTSMLESLWDVEFRHRDGVILHVFTRTHAESHISVYWVALQKEQFQKYLFISFGLFLESLQGYPSHHTSHVEMKTIQVSSKPAWSAVLAVSLSIRMTGEFLQCGMMQGGGQTAAGRLFLSGLRAV